MVNGVQASNAALVSVMGETPQVLATYEIDEAAVRADLDRAEDAESVFRMRLDLEDICGPVGILLLGPRSDGASYNADERDAVRLIETALAESLRAICLRADRNSDLATLLTQVDARIARLEGIKNAIRLPRACVKLTR